MKFTGISYALSNVLPFSYLSSLLGTQNVFEYSIRLDFGRLHGSAYGFVSMLIPNDILFKFLADFMADRLEVRFWP